MKKLIIAASLAMAVIPGLASASDFKWVIPEDQRGEGIFVGNPSACAGTANSCTQAGLKYWFSTVQSTKPGLCNSGVQVYCSPVLSLWKKIEWRHIAGGRKDCMVQPSCPSEQHLIATSPYGDNLLRCQPGKRKALCGTP